MFIFLRFTCPKIHREWWPNGGLTVSSIKHQCGFIRRRSAALLGFSGCCHCCSQVDNSLHGLLNPGHPAEHKPLVECLYKELLSYSEATKTLCFVSLCSYCHLTGPTFINAATLCSYSYEKWHGAPCIIQQPVLAQMGAAASHIMAQLFTSLFATNTRGSQC